MEYRLDVDGAPETVPGGTGILLVHASTADTDHIDSQFLAADTDHYLVVSTRTTAEEVDEKLEFFGVDRSAATVIDAISIERGYSRRESDRVYYLTGPDDIDGLLRAAGSFFEAHDGKLRVSFDSVTGLAFFADEDRALGAVQSLLELIDRHEAVGLFHLATDVLDGSTVDDLRELFDVVIDLDG